MLLFINGDIIPEDNAHIHLKDRGLLLGDGIFETCKAEHGYILFFKEHYDRLKHSSEFLSIPLPYSQEQLFDICKNLLKSNVLKNDSAAILITLTRGEGLRGINFPDKPKPTLFVTTAKYAVPTNYHPTALVTSIKRNPQSPIISHKTLNYLEPILARAEAQSKGYDEGIMINIDGFIAESSIANIFFITGNQVITPDLGSGILPGITRKLVIQLCQRNNIQIVEKKIPLSDADRKSV